MDDIPSIPEISLFALCHKGITTRVMAENQEKLFKEYQMSKILRTVNNEYNG